uniref:DUF4234 domain-containing protein n=1 Tax=Thaumasiovibrio occultus TaxID=1891184 RepID=UPI00131E931E|nr:DUF4234 domain-containing protein [Thaumasiovibrio occultus]
MADINKFKLFKDQSTWRLFFLSIITLGIYGGHYMLRQTRIMNALLPEKQQMSIGFSQTLLVMLYISGLMILPYFFVDIPVFSPYDLIDSGITNITTLLIFVWVFTARAKMHLLFRVPKGDYKWFHGAWTFFFTILYFNYKINKVCEQTYFDDNEPDDNSNNHSVEDSTFDDLKRPNKPNDSDNIVM